MNKRNLDSTVKEKVLTDYKKLQLVWGRMRQSCTDVNHMSYKYYGAKGVTVDAEAWPTGAAFADWALLNGFEPGLTVERIDSNGNYTPSNVRFVTNIAQQRNRDNTVRYDYKGQQLTLGEIFERELGAYTNTDISRAYSRLQRGRTIQEALYAPVYVQKVTTYHYNGEQMTLPQIAHAYFGKATKQDIHRLHQRVADGWSIEDALTKPVKVYRRKTVEWLA